MLGAMDIPGAAAGTETAPWLVLGASLGVLLVVLAGLAAALLLRRRNPVRPDQGAPADDARDDLPGFLESPPGSGTGPAARAEGWAALTAPAAPAAPPVAPPRGRRDAVVVLTTMAVTALLLVGAAAAVAAASGPDGRHRSPRDDAPAARDAAAARLTFGGVVLEPRAVGVTAAYPVVEVTTNGDRSWAHVEFPTFNCLTAEAPVDPVAAGCTRSVPEYADLESPDLAVEREGDDLRVSGRFPTEVRPNGSAPEPTGRAYDLRISVRPVEGPAGRGWQPAEGVLELGTERAVTLDEPGVSVFRSGS
jgi:hypothetical protein